MNKEIKGYTTPQADAPRRIEIYRKTTDKLDQETEPENVEEIGSKHTFDKKDTIFIVKLFVFGVLLVLGVFLFTTTFFSDSFTDFKQREMKTQQPQPTEITSPTIVDVLNLQNKGGFFQDQSGNYKIFNIVLASLAVYFIFNMFYKIIGYRRIF